MATPPPSNKAPGLLKQFITTQPTIPIPIIQQTTTPTVPLLPLVSSQPPAPKKIQRVRLLALILSALLTLILFFSWHMLSQQKTNPTTISPQTFTTLSPKNTATQTANSTITTPSGPTIQVYIVGAIKHPGVYTLPNSARVYQLLQAAGGPLANANLIAVNLAAKLNDGQEVYVSAIGETPPASISTGPTQTGSTTSTNQLVNINTATVDELHQNLHVGTATAQHIVTYRLQHGNFTSIDQLLQVVSKNIYDKIKGQIVLS